MEVGFESLPRVTDYKEIDLKSRKRRKTDKHVLLKKTVKT